MQKGWPTIQTFTVESSIWYKYLLDYIRWFLLKNLISKLRLDI